MNSIPVISLHDYRTKGLSGVDCDALAHACKDHGFFIIEPVSYTHLTLPTNREV